MRPSLDLTALRARYADGVVTPTAVVEDVLARIAAYDDPACFLALEPPERLRVRARALEATGPAGLPLWGVPFAVKDNIDVAGLPTTAACPEFAYVPRRSATVVERLVAAGAVVVGKTNLDQFATGLVGVRSPYGVPRNPLDARLVPGGSSSGSGVAVAAGLVTFALGTDTAGSGRVPAALGNVVGLKPTRGLVSTRGVVPACRTLDCVSVFALTAEDAAAVLAIAAGFDAADPYSRTAPSRPAEGARVRVGVPSAVQRAGGDDAQRAAFERALARLEGLGWTVEAVDVRPLLEAGRLLYEGPWVAERFVAMRQFMAAHAEAMHPVTREIVAAGARPTAADAFAAQYRLAGLKREADVLLERVDAVVLPTVPFVPSIREVEDDPIGCNARLGRWSTFVNLLDLAAVAVPAGFDVNGRPHGVTIVGPAFADDALLRWAGQAHRALATTLGATRQPVPRAPASVGAAAGDGVLLVVCGAHMRGLPLERELAIRGGRFVAAARTAPEYRLYALPGGPPARPGLVRAAGGGAIEVELWEMPAAGLGTLVAGVPPPLAIGTVRLDDGRHVKGFVCEAAGAAGARDITSFGGWRPWIARAGDDLERGGA